eukprot:1155993-Pelagomonas_calceolata.AAC.2
MQPLMHARNIRLIEGKSGWTASTFQSLAALFHKHICATCSPSFPRASAWPHAQTLVYKHSACTAKLLTA